MKSFTVQYCGNTITVANSIAQEHLYVNGEIQDHAWGLGWRSLLWGRCKDSEGNDVTLKVRIGGFFIMSCDIFANDRLIMNQGTPVSVSQTNS